ncbi:hypothetical protein DRP04_01855 [Archaeoglobales archaeon]|nr:MAG: hypothetical protein DRP04_01855 [Archaeoglobales archaeon]
MSKIYFKPSSITWGDEHTVGDILEATVMVADLHNCTGAYFSISFDPDIFEFLEVVRGDFLSTGLFLEGWIEDGTLNQVACITLDSPTDVVEESFAIIRFRVLKKDVKSAISIFEAGWYDADYAERPFDEVDDFVFTFGVVPVYPKLRIVDVRAPTEAYFGEVVRVEVDWENEGNSGVAWTRLVDMETNTELVERTRWQISSGDAGTLTLEFLMPNKTLKARVEVGHEE